MDSRLCMHVWTSASLHRWPGRTGTRDHASRLGTGWAPTHMPTLGAGADGCQGGYSGHNGRMWCIVLAHGAMGRGLPEANVTVWHMWRGRWLIVVRAEPVETELNRELELFTAVGIMECYRWHNMVRKGRRRGYENDSYWAGAAKICLTKVLFFASFCKIAYKLEC